MLRRGFLKSLAVLAVSASKIGLFVSGRRNNKYIAGIDWASGPDRSDNLLIYRLVERFPKWIKDPDTFWNLADKTKTRLLAYETLRVRGIK